MSFTLSYAGVHSLAFYTGTSPVASDVPSTFDVAFDGRSFSIDQALDANGLRGLYFRRDTISLLRDQADNSVQPDLSSINPADLWPRDWETWLHGAGQNHSDRKASDDEMFRTSKGVDCWTPWQISLLPDTTQSRSSANTGLKLCSAGSFLYLLDGTAVRYFDTTWHAVTGYTGTPTGIASDGHTIWTAHGSSGIYSTTRGSGTGASYNTTHADVIGYVNGRLMVGSGPVLTNILGVTTQDVLTPPEISANSDWVWTGFADGPVSLYACGFSGDRGMVWQATIKSDGTGLNAPTVALTLPDGEVPQAIRTYLGWAAIGTNLGLRVAHIESDGTLTMGDLIPTPSPVLCLTSYARFVYFGWTDYDSLSTGIGRADLSVFTNAGFTPAYASDLMVTGQGSVGGLAIHAGQPALSVDSLGVYLPSTSKVTTGSLTSGLVGYGLTDPKTAMYVDLRTQPLPTGSSVSVSLSADDSTPKPIGDLAGTGVTGPSPQFSCNETSGETFELTYALNRAADPTVGPVVRRVKLRAEPRPVRASTWQVPVLVREQENPQGLGDVSRDVAADKTFLFGLASSSRSTRFQVLGETFQVFVVDVEEVPVQIGQLRDTMQSTVVMSLKQVVA